MIIHQQIPQLEAPSAVTIGKFFALHRGHQALLSANAQAARENGLRSLVLTFDRHPRELLQPGAVMPELTSLEERLQLMRERGIDHVVVAPLSPEFLAQSPEEFAGAILVQRLRCRIVVAAPGLRFGRGASGDLDLLGRLGELHGFRLHLIPPVLHQGEPISSSRVAAAVSAGDVSLAAELLGRPYSASGLVVRGDGVGRQLGWPTANLRVPERRLLPARGVYVVSVRHRGDLLPGVANLGVRPTLSGEKSVLEAHILDWNGDLYGQEATLLFHLRLRDEQRFSGVEELRRQIALDVEAARRFHRPPA